jgi:hypothetical protein
LGVIGITLGIASCGLEEERASSSAPPAVSARPPDAGADPLAALANPLAALANPPAALANPPAASSTNRAPSVSGDPLKAVVFGVTYSFRPTAKDPDGKPLSFSITNRPAWASFSTATGRLRGKPGAGDVGTYKDITISVSDGTHRASLRPFSVNVVATATGSITVSWLAPTERSDGSPLTNLAGYKLYWGTSRGDYPNSATVNHPGIARYVIEQLTPGTYYLVATAFDSKGLESAYSSVLSQTIR